MSLLVHRCPKETNNQAPLYIFNINNKYTSDFLKNGMDVKESKNYLILQDEQEEELPILELDGLEYPPNIPRLIPQTELEEEEEGEEPQEPPHEEKEKKRKKYLSPPPPPPFSPPLNDDAVLECLLNKVMEAKENKNKKGPEYLLEVYDANKQHAPGDIRYPSDEELQRCEFFETKANGSYYACYLCDTKTYQLYCTNRKRCTYHLTCLSCFKFTYSMLRYKYGSSVEAAATGGHRGARIECPLQRLGVNCRVRGVHNLWKNNKKEKLFINEE